MSKEEIDDAPVTRHAKQKDAYSRPDRYVRERIGTRKGLVGTTVRKARGKEGIAFGPSPHKPGEIVVDPGRPGSFVINLSKLNPELVEEMFDPDESPVKLLRKLSKVTSGDEDMHPVPKTPNSSSKRTKRSSMDAVQPESVPVNSGIFNQSPSQPTHFPQMGIPNISVPNLGVSSNEFQALCGVVGNLVEQMKGLGQLISQQQKKQRHVEEDDNEEEEPTRLTKSERIAKKEKEREKLEERRRRIRAAKLARDAERMEKEEEEEEEEEEETLETPIRRKKKEKKIVKPELTKQPELTKKSKKLSVVFDMNSPGQRLGRQKATFHGFELNDYAVILIFDTESQDHQYEPPETNSGDHPIRMTVHIGENSYPVEYAGLSFSHRNFDYIILLLRSDEEATMGPPTLVNPGSGNGRAGSLNFGGQNE